MVPDFVLAISKSLSVNTLCGDGRTRFIASLGVSQCLKVAQGFFR